jgi:intracellular septation protein A
MKQLLDDLLSTIVFLVLYLVTGNVFIAIGLAIAAGIAQIAWLKARGRIIDTMQWASLALVVVLGGATIAFDDGRFIMMKPSIAHFAIAAVMLRRGWMGRYLPSIASDNLPESLIVGAGYAWSALMVGIGLANLVVAWTFDVHVWIWFISVFALGAKLVFFAGQFALFHYVVRRNLKLRAA